MNQRLTSILILSVVVLFAACLSTEGYAQNQKAQPISPPTTEQLRQQVAKLKQSIAQEKRAQANHQQTADDRQKTLEAKRAELAKTLLKTHVAITQTNRDIQNLSKKNLALRQQAKTLTEQTASINSQLIVTIDRLDISLRELPVQDAARDQLRTIRSTLTNDASTQTSIQQAITTFAAMLAELHTQSTHLTLKAVRLHTAQDNALETVTLLMIGHARFIYLTQADQRIGIAIAAPNKAQGYRWTESLPESYSQALRQTMQQLIAAQNAGNTTPITIETMIDPTGQIQNHHLQLKQQTLFDQLKQGGLIMYPLAGIAALAFLLILQRVLALYLMNRRSQSTAARVIQYCAQRQFDTAQAICVRSNSSVTRVLIACLDRHQQSQHAMEDGIQAQLLTEMPRLNRFMGGIAILAAVAPLLGLLGTVTGIIQTFGVIQTQGNADPQLMAGGISEALITTATGLTIAIPILIVHSLLRGRAARILADAERNAAHLLTTLAHDVSPTNNHTEATDD